MYGYKTDQREWIILGELLLVKVSESIPESLFSSYFEKSPLIQMNRSGTLRDWPKL